jgi:putative ABC transport system permease protein
VPENGPIDLSWLDLSIAASLLLINGLFSMWLGLGLGKKLLVGAVRTVVQLTLLGYVLVYVFDVQRGLLVGAMAMVMVVLASIEAVRRTSHRYRGIRLHAFLSLVVAAGVSTLLVTVLVVRPDPWWAPRYLIPLLGMVLGNGLNGISLGLERCLSSFDDGRDRIELMVAAGATPWEASRPVAAESIRTGLIPILNSMSVVGLVTIPGMMTGQILGGSSPEVAARYQMLVMFLIAGATAAGTGGVVLFAVRALFDKEGRLRSERLRG